GEDRVGAPVDRIGGAALGLCTAAPFIGEQQLRRVVRERGRVPEGEVGIRDGLQPHRVRGILDVEQQPVARARAGGVVRRRIYGNVVALRRAAACSAARDAQ